MRESIFFEKYSPSLIPADYDNGEYGDYLFLHPEDLDQVIDYADNSEQYQVVSVHELKDGDHWVNMDEPCDFGYQPYKVGYFVIRRYNKKT